MSTVTVRQLALSVRGEIVGDGDLRITGARSLGDAWPGDITLVDGHDRLGAWRASRASAAVTPAAVTDPDRPLIRVPDPLAAFARIYAQFHRRPDPDPVAVDPAAHVHPTARLGPGVGVGPFAVVGAGAEVGADTTLHAGVVVGRGCRVGAGCVLHPRVVLYDGCVLGDRVTVHANAVLGADGFGYRVRGGRPEKVPQLGWVEIEDDVEVGAGTTVDCGTFGPTRIGAGTKIDNLVMIAHNCRIGRRNLIAAQAGVAGSVVTGDDVVIAGQAGVADHVTVGDRAVVAAQSGVTKDVPADVRVVGFPARPRTAMLRVYAAMEGLPALARELKRLKASLKPGG